MGQPHRVEAHQVQDRRVEAWEVEKMARHVDAVFVGFPDRGAGLRAG